VSSLLAASCCCSGCCGCNLPSTYAVSYSLTQAEIANLWLTSPLGAFDQCNAPQAPPATGTVTGSVTVDLCSCDQFSQPGCISYKSNFVLIATYTGTHCASGVIGCNANGCCCLDVTVKLYLEAQIFRDCVSNTWTVAVGVEPRWSATNGTCDSGCCAASFPLCEDTGLPANFGCSCAVSFGPSSPFWPATWIKTTGSLDGCDPRGTYASGWVVS